MFKNHDEARAVYKEYGIITTPFLMGVNSEDPTKKFCKPLGKRPTSFEESDQDFKYALRKAPSSKVGIGGILGNHTNNYYAVDVDRPEEFNVFLTESPNRSMIEDILNHTPVQKSHSGRFHFLLNSSTTVKKREVPYGDLMANNSLLFLDCTLHPVSKTQYNFVNGLFEPLTVDDTSIFGYKTKQKGEEQEPKEPIKKKEIVPILAVTDNPIIFETLPEKYKAILLAKPTNDIRIKYVANQSYDRSAAEQAVIMYCIKLSYSFESVLNLFETYAALGTKYRSTEDRRGVWLRHSYDRACNAYSPEGYDARLDLLDDIDFKASGVKGRQATLFAVCKVIKDIAKRSGETKNLGLPVRTLAMQAGISSIDTVAKALKSLVAAKILDRVGFDKSNRFRINLGLIGNSEQFSRIKKEKNCTGIPLFLSNDSFRFKGLNKTGFLIIQSLSIEDYKTIKDLVSLTRLSYKTIQSKLELLRSMEFVTDDGKKRSKGFKLVKILEDEDFRRISLMLDTLGIGEKQTIKIAKDRKYWNESPKNPENKKKLAAKNRLSTKEKVDGEKVKNLADLALAK